jgi:hypothetical protein
MKIATVPLSLFCLLFFSSFAHANLVDELLATQERSEKLRIEKLTADKVALIKNCKLPFINQNQLIEDVAEFARVHPYSVKVISAEVWGVQNSYCRVHIYHGKGTCHVGVDFDKYGFLTSSLHKLRSGSCVF